MENNMEFKNVIGGDPSRRKPKVIVTWSCETCHKQHDRETTNPQKFTAPKFCNKTCENLQQEESARATVREYLDREMPSRVVNEGILPAIVKYGKFIKQMESNPRNVLATDFVCPHCSTASTSYKLRSDTKAEKSKFFCSASCAQSSKRGFPVGVICRNVFKRRYATEAEALEAVTLANIDLTPENGESMIQYKCICGQWHFGHLSKAHDAQAWESAYFDLKQIFHQRFLSL